MTTFADFDTVNPQAGLVQTPDTLRISTDTGSMWGAGATCANLVLAPARNGDQSITVTVELLPQHDGEQAGLVLYAGWDDWFKLVREQVNGEQVVVLAQSIGGQARPLIIEPYTPACVQLELKRKGSELCCRWSGTGIPAREEILADPLALQHSLRCGLLVHGRNPNNAAVFSQVSQHETHVAKTNFV